MPSLPLLHTYGQLRSVHWPCAYPCSPCPSSSRDITGPSRNQRKRLIWVTSSERAFWQLKIEHSIWQLLMYSAYQILWPLDFDDSFALSKMTCWIMQPYRVLWLIGFCDDLVPVPRKSQNPIRPVVEMMVHCIDVWESWSSDVCQQICDRRPMPTTNNISMQFHLVVGLMTDTTWEKRT